MGHSMGGRSILRLMYDYNIETANTKVAKKSIKNIILFSPEVNYKHNAQASLFASTDDENEYPWKDYSERKQLKMEQSIMLKQINSEVQSQSE